MSHYYDVIATGDYYFDLVFSGLPSLPELGREIIGTGFDMMPGGAYNSAVAMHRLGLRVAWATDFGNDTFSQTALDYARSEGLDESFFIQHGRPMRRITVALSYPEDRAFVTYLDPEPEWPAAMQALQTASARLLYIPGFYHGALFDEGARLARLKGMQVIMDGGSPEGATLADPTVERAVAAVDVFMPNAREARHMTGRNNLADAISVLAELCPCVVLKAGPDGAYACASGKLLHAPAIAVTPLDTTGAGDCFNAGFVRAWLDGLPLKECLRWGNVVGGLSTEARGGTARRVTLDDVREWLRAHP